MEIPTNKFTYHYQLDQHDDTYASVQVWLTDTERKMTAEFDPIIITLDKEEDLKELLVEAVYMDEPMEIVCDFLDLSLLDLMQK